MKKPLLFLSLLVVFTAFKSNKPAYRLFNAKGKMVKYRKKINAAKNADVVFFGELHNNPVSHWLELEILSRVPRCLSATTS